MVRLNSFPGSMLILMNYFPDNTGWCWYIPINDDTISIGFVMHEEFVKPKKQGRTLEQLYLDQFNFLTEVNTLRGMVRWCPTKKERAAQFTWPATTATPLKMLEN
jgi:hypothetical protein